MTKTEASPELLSAELPDKSTDQMKELSEDMELISPGLMLSEAREKHALSQDDIAQRLNLRVSLVADIEKNVFDSSIAETFKRGYLASYAKLVSVDVEDVLASYDVLGAANLQRSEMQSFSKQTVKEAEHSRVMWLSYIILIVLVGLTALWWYQDTKQSASLFNDTPTDKVVESESAKQTTPAITDTIKSVPGKSLTNDSLAQAEESNDESETSNSVDNLISTANVADTNVELTKPSDLVEPKSEAIISPELSTNELTPEAVVMSRAVFTFIGDCWVNIYDATGERIAWGIKKSGYVMTIEGQAPLLITLGKPELASIVFNDSPVDMSTFNQGNIAKFTLPLTP